MSVPTPAVGIVVRTKDRPDFLERALASIAHQTFTAWECVIVNDGGNPTDVDRVVAALPPAQRAKVLVLHAPESRGRWRSANAGVLATSSPLLVLHDDDDSWHPEFLARAVEHLDRNSDRDGVLSRIEIVWERRVDDGFEVVRRELFQPDLQDVLLADTLLFNRFVPIAFVYRRSLHEELGLYDDSLPVIGDWAFNLRVLQRGPLGYLPGEPLAYWHQRSDSLGTDGNSVISASAEHARYDALIRDHELRGYVSEHGLGLVLYLTKFIDRRFVDVEAGIRQEIIASSAWRRALRAVRARLRRR